MILSRRASLDGVMLDELHEEIIIKSIDPGIGKQTISAVDRAGLYGQRITDEHWSTIDATVTFGINTYKRKMELRNEIFDDAIAWALSGNWLVFNTMPGKRLRVDKVVLPSRGDLWDINAEYTITFRAYHVPYWQQATPTTVKKNNITNGSVSIEVGGTAPSVLDIAFRNISGKEITNFSVKAGNKTLTLNGVKLGAAETLKISHGTDGLLKITAGSRNVYSIYTGDNDLLVKPGVNTVTVNATRAGELTVTNYGRYY